MSSVIEHCTMLHGSVYDNANDMTMTLAMVLTMSIVNDDVFVVSNFRDPFYSAKKRSNNKQKSSGNFKICLVRFSST